MNIVTNDGRGPIKKYSLLKDDLDFWHVLVFNYRDPKATKLSPPLLGEKLAVDVYLKCIREEKNEQSLFPS